MVRDGDAFYLRRDIDGRYKINLRRTSVDLVEKRARRVDTIVGPGLVNADGMPLV